MPKECLGVSSPLWVLDGAMGSEVVSSTSGHPLADVQVTSCDIRTCLLLKFPDWVCMWVPQLGVSSPVWVPAGSMG